MITPLSLLLRQQPATLLCVYGYVVLVIGSAILINCPPSHAASKPPPMQLSKLLAGPATPVVTPKPEAPYEQLAPLAQPVVATPAVTPPTLSPTPIIPKPLAPAPVDKTKHRVVKAPALRKPKPHNVLATPKHPPFKLAPNQVMAIPRQTPWHKAAQQPLPLPAASAMLPSASVSPPKALQWVGQAVSKPQAASTHFDVDLLAADWNTTWPQAQPLTLEDTLILAFANDLSLTLAKWEQNKATLAQKEALAALLPSLELSYTQSRFQGGVQVFDGVPNKARISTIRPEVRLLLPINLGGRDIFAYKEAGAKVATKGYITQALQQDALASVAQTYLKLLETYLQHELSRQTQKEATQQLALSQARFDEGIGVMIDVLESRSALEKEQRKQVELEQDVAKLSAQLTPLLGLTENTLLKPNLAQALTFSFLAEPIADHPPSAHVAPLDAEMGTPPPYQPADATYTTLVERAMTQTYSLKQATEALHTAELALKKTVANALPTVNLSTYANLIGKEANDLMTSRFAGVEVSMKLLEGLGLKVYAQIKQAQADVAMAKLAHEQAERMVKAQVAQALSGYRTAHKQLALAETQLATAEKARHQAMGRYEEGVGNYLEVLTSATQLQQARAAVVSLTLQSKQAELALATAVGDLKPKLMTALGLVDEPLVTAKKSKGRSTASPEFSVPPIRLTQYQAQSDALAPLRLPASDTPTRKPKP